jgi:hypothetical protein
LGCKLQIADDLFFKNATKSLPGALSLCDFWGVHETMYVAVPFNINETIKISKKAG